MRNIPAGEDKEATCNVNSAHNIPHICPRTFAFPDSDELRKYLVVAERVAPCMKDIILIWEYARDMTQSQELIEAMRESSNGDYEKRYSPSKLSALAKKYGIDSMIDAYYAGVPLEDILA